RVANRDALTAALGAVTRGWTRNALLAALETAGIPAGPINDMADVFADPQIIARGLRISPEGIPGVRTPIRFSDAELSLDRASPRLGQGNKA
ncbi:MAG: CoA transferase, partial [Paracoccus denitrificans]